jgi:hypothetical protein
LATLGKEVSWQEQKKLPCYGASSGNQKTIRPDGVEFYRTDSQTRQQNLQPTLFAVHGDIVAQPVGEAG